MPRVLEVEKGKLCFIIGTVYMDMPLKPNVLDDIARDVSPSRNLQDMFEMMLRSTRFLRLHHDPNFTPIRMP